MCLGIGVWSIIGGGMRRSKNKVNYKCPFFSVLTFSRKTTKCDSFFSVMCMYICKVFDIEIWKD